jgi:hypothetical protein
LDHSVSTVFSGFESYEEKIMKCIEKIIVKYADKYYPNPVFSERQRAIAFVTEVLRDLGCFKGEI